MGSNDHIHIRVSSEEKAKFKEKSEKHGGQSAYFRLLVNKYENKEILKKDPAPTAAMLQNGITWHLSRIGNNLNQLAHAINKANIADKIGDAMAKEIMKELMYMNIQLSEAIERDLGVGRE